DLLGLGGTRTLDQIMADLRSSGRYSVPAQTIEQGRLVQPATDVSDALYSFSDGSFGPSQYKVIGSNSIDEAGLRAEAERLFSTQSPGSGELLRNFSLSDFVKDPGYEFRLAEGNKAIENRMRALGISKSPATIKELLRYGQDYASN